MGFAVAEDQEFTLPPLEERPLVTFALFAYNQEKYIREAVEGAFAQTYEPLEIILSDDCSTDRTFEIMEEMAAKYEGPHKIILNRNTQNLGICPHVTKIHERCSGEYIVHAAGDDYSYPNRTEILIAAFTSCGHCPSIVSSNSMYMDENSSPIGYVNNPSTPTTFEKNLNPLNRTLPLNGHTLALHRALVDCFDQPSYKIIAEDSIFTFRAHLMNGVLYLNKTLLNYRISDKGAWSSMQMKSKSTNKILENQLTWSKDYLKRLAQFSVDLNCIEKPVNQKNDIIKSIEAFKIKSAKSIEIIESKFIAGLLLLFNILVTQEQDSKYKLHILKLFILKWLPILHKIKITARASKS